MAAFNWCPECGEYRAHSPGANQCMVCDAKGDNSRTCKTYWCPRNGNAICYASGDIRFHCLSNSGKPFSKAIGTCK